MWLPNLLETHMLKQVLWAVRAPARTGARNPALAKEEQLLDWYKQIPEFNIYSVRLEWLQKDMQLPFAALQSTSFAATPGGVFQLLSSPLTC